MTGTPGDHTPRRHLTTVTDTTTDPTNPHTNPTLEREVLAALITAPRAHETHTQNTLDAITDHTFTTPLHRDLIAAIRTTWDNGHDLDGETIYRALNTARAGIPPLPYLAFYELIEGDHSIPLAPGHVAALNDLAERRLAYDASNTLRLISYTPDITTLRPRLTAALTEALNDTPTTALTPTEDTWAAIDVAAYHDDGHEETATILTLTNGTGLLYPGKMHSISGEPGTGKSWAAILGTAQQLLAGNPIAYIDFEDQFRTFYRRLTAIGINPHHYAHLIRYIRPQVALDTTRRTQLLHTLSDTTLVTIDGITEAMTLHGWSYNDNEDVARFLLHIPRAIADTGPAVLQIDHVTKNTETRTRYAIGGQHKLAGIDGAAYKLNVNADTAPAKGRRGIMRLVIDKDRHGTIGPTGHSPAEMVLDSTDPTHPVGLWLQNPAAETGDRGQFRPTHLMEKVSRYLEINPSASGRAITDTLGGNAKAVRTAVAVLIEEGFISTTDGPHRSTLHHVDTPYRQDNDR